MNMKAETQLRVLLHGVAICGSLPIRVSRLGCTPWLGNTRSIGNYTYGHHASAVSILATKVNSSSLDYRENAQQMAAAVDRMKYLHEKFEAGGTSKAREKHVARGKMLPRE